MVGAADSGYRMPPRRPVSSSAFAGKRIVARRSEGQSIYRVRKAPSTFATIHKAFLSDPRLSFACKGLLTYLLSKPDDWQAMSCDLMRVSGDGRDAIRRMVRQLSAAGYLRRCAVRDRKSGRISRYETIVFETPELAAVAEPREQGTLFEKFEAVKGPVFQRDLPVTGNPSTVNPATEKPSPGNRPLLRMSSPKIETTNCGGDSARWHKPTTGAERARQMLRKEAGL